MLLPILAIAGFLIYQHNKNAVNNGPTPIPDVSKNQTTQPSQKYPMRAPVVARVDNSTQPWFGGNKTFQQVTSQLPAGIVQQAANPNSFNAMTGLNIANQATDLWNNLDAGSWFTGGSADTTPSVADANSADGTVSYAPVDFTGGDPGAMYNA